MKIFNNIFNFESGRKTVVTIGTFDGVHVGHRHILKKVTAIAASKNLASTVLTFFPHPRMVLQPESDLKLINTIEERTALLEQNGIENLIIHPFSQDFSRTSAHDYVKKILADQLQAQVVVIGYDHRFGRNRAASITELKEYGEIYDFEVIEISKEEVEEVAVSSTKVRHAITAGDMLTATKYLKQPYFLSGEVIHGKKIGRTLGYPTANIKIDHHYKLTPCHGVYITSAVIDDVVVYGVTNIGTNPTVAAGTAQHIETYFIDFKEDIYGRQLHLHFHKRMRDEVRFDSLEQLQAAMHIDVQQARDYVKSLG